MPRRAKGKPVGTVKCPFCGQTIEIRQGATKFTGSCSNKKCGASIMVRFSVLGIWKPQGKESLGLSGPEPVAESPPTPPDNHEPIRPEPEVPEAAPVKAPPVVEPKVPEVQPKEAPVAPPPPPAPVIPAPDKTPSLFKTKKKEEPDNAPVAPAPVKSPTLFKIKKKEEQDDDRKDG